MTLRNIGLVLVALHPFGGTLAGQTGRDTAVYDRLRRANSFPLMDRAVHDFVASGATEETVIALIRSAACRSRHGKIYPGADQMEPLSPARFLPPGLWRSGGLFQNVLVVPLDALPSNFHGDLSIALWLVARLELRSDAVQHVLEQEVGDPRCADSCAQAAYAIGQLAPEADAILRCLDSPEEGAFWGAVVGFEHRKATTPALRRRIEARLGEPGVPAEATLWLAAHDEAFRRTDVVARALRAALQPDASDVARSAAAWVLSIPGLDVLPGVVDLLRGDMLVAEARETLFAGISLNPEMCRVSGQILIEEARRDNLASKWALHGLRHLATAPESIDTLEAFVSPEPTEKSMFAVLSLAHARPDDPVMRETLLRNCRDWTSKMAGRVHVEALSVLIAWPKAREELARLRTDGDLRVRAEAGIALHTFAWERGRHR